MEFGNGKKNQLVWRSSENRYHNEEFKVNEDNDNVNVAILARQVNAESTVLDIGCGEGKFGAMLLNKKCQLYGIDIDSEACRNASEKYKYNKIFCTNIEAPDYADEGFAELESLSFEFDYIALIDILEHVINPTRVIENSVRYLKDKGKILISVPNVNNADIFLNLLNDHFNYREAGVLDNTHTKYFTRHSFIEWIEDINSTADFALDCEYIGSTFGETEFMQEVEKKYPNVYELIQLNPWFNAIQHLFVLTYYKNKKEANTNHLEGLLQEKGNDLVGKLNQVLDFSGADLQEKDFSMLPNERRTLKEQVFVSEEGWKKCADELKKAKAFEEKNQRDIDELKQALEQSQQMVSEKNAELKNVEDKLAQSTAALEETRVEWKKCAGALEETRTEWKECAEALENAKKGWGECAEALENAKKGWKECADALESAKKGWKECADALEQERKSK